MSAAIANKRDVRNEENWKCDMLQGSCVSANARYLHRRDRVRKPIVAREHPTKRSANRVSVISLYAKLMWAIVTFLIFFANYKEHDDHPI
jgi:hypothetical protein